MVDYEKASQELVSALRGKRSQAALNRRLGYRSNAVYTWETGRCHPSMSKFLHLLERTSLSPSAWLSSFAGLPPSAKRLDYAPLIVEFMNHVRGNTRVAELSRRLPYSRYALMRWLGGKAEPTVPQFFRFVEATTHRSLDLIAALVDPGRLPATATAWKRLNAARDVAYRSPWSHAVLRCLELESYRGLPVHEPGWIARRLGIALAEEEECLAQLARAGQVKKREGKWTFGRALTVDTRSERERDRALKTFWAKVSAERTNRARLVGYNLFAVARRDEEKIVELTRSYFEQVRSIVSASEPSERVLLLHLVLLPFEDTAG